MKRLTHKYILLTLSLNIMGVWHWEKEQLGSEWYFRECRGEMLLTKVSTERNSSEDCAIFENETSFPASLYDLRMDQCTASWLKQGSMEAGRVMTVVQCEKVACYFSSVLLDIWRLPEAAKRVLSTGTACVLRGRALMSERPPSDLLE